MAKTLVMGFVSETGKKVSLSISAVKDAITAAEASSVMDTIITKNIFNSAGGDLKFKDSAQLIDKTTEILSIS